MKNWFDLILGVIRAKDTVRIHSLKFSVSILRETICSFRERRGLFEPSKVTSRYADVMSPRGTFYDSL